ncbi:integrase/recombinase XerC [Azospirillum agricola]|uniref:tyrosine-type recombinase/integrase n=1 Tax=Azospirillum agricola TaxID=1720247 RepID=UPI001AE680FC|nr:tyrosine-type recombinase/integrase [Azospirillum agricola]MBP2227198.1 integrase/recombinase XerC [Azospirillum agricola]
MTLPVLAETAPAGARDLADARHAAALLLDRIQEHLLDAFYAGRGANTVRAYRQDHEDFRAFVARQTGIAGFGDSAERVVRLLLAIEHGQANALALGYRNDMTGRGLQPATVNRRLAALRSVVKQGNMLGLVAWALEVENVDSSAYRDTRGPGREGVKAMIAQAKGRTDAKGVRDTAIVRLLHDVALRRGEVVSLDLEHYESRRGTLAVLGKGRTQRERVSLPAATRTALEAWVAERGIHPGPLFHRLDAAGRGGRRLTGSAVHQIVRGLGTEVGIATRPHGLRHTAITSALDASNGDVRKVQRFSRHRDVRLLQTYDDNRSDFAGERRSRPTSSRGGTRRPSWGWPPRAS